MTIKPCRECGVDFNFKTQNQKYCSPDCSRTATNKRIMEKYYEKKARLNGKTKYCDCGARLSRYSTEVVCIICKEKNKVKKTESAIEAIKNAAIKSSKTKSK